MMDLNEEEAVGIDSFISEKALLPAVITAQNLCSINSCPDQQMYRARIQFLFQLEAYVQDAEGNTDYVALQALIDMVHDAILFATDNQMPYAKSIVFLTIYIAILQQAITTRFYNPERLFAKYQHYVICHSVDRPPFSAAIFGLPDIKIMNEFFANFFRNLKMIKNCLTPKPVLGFRATFPIQLPVPKLPPLADMEIEQKIGETENETEPITPEDTSRTNDSQKQSGMPTAPQTGPPTAPHTAQSTHARSLPQSQPPEEDKPSEEEKQENRGPDVPIDILRETLAGLHEKFVSDFDDKERQIVGKIKELEIKMNERQAASLKKTPIKGKK